MFATAFAAAHCEDKHDVLMVHMVMVRTWHPVCQGGWCWWRKWQACRPVMCCLAQRDLSQEPETARNPHPASEWAPICLRHHLHQWSWYESHLNNFLVSAIQVWRHLIFLDILSLSTSERRPCKAEQLLVKLIFSPAAACTILGSVATAPMTAQCTKRDSLRIAIRMVLDTSNTGSKAGKRGSSVVRRRRRMLCANSCWSHRVANKVDWTGCTGRKGCIGATLKISRRQ